MSDATIAINSLLSIEGGFTDDAADPGGATNWGITQAPWDAYRTSVAMSGMSSATLPADVADIARIQAIAYYTTEWWNRYQFAQITDQHVASAYFHLAVNEGVTPATRVLQQAVNSVSIANGSLKSVDEDGTLGPLTVAAVNAEGDTEDEELLFAFLFTAAVSYGLTAAARPASLRFLRGWMNRLRTEI